MAHFKHYLKITVRVLAETSGRCEETVRRHIRSGKVDPYSLRSIRKWLDEVGRVEEVEDEESKA